MRRAVKTALGAVVLVNAHHLLVAAIRMFTRTRDGCLEAWDCEVFDG